VRCAIAATGVLLGVLCAHAGAQGSCPSPRDEVFVPAGRYQPFFKRPGGGALTVPAMCVGASPVSNQQFLAFVRDHPEWRKSRVERLFAESNYLADWPADFTTPDGALSEPVTFVYWFAAGAYCESQGRRLPKVSEWERMAGGLVPAQRSAPFAVAMGRPAADLAATPLRLGGLWEWTEDFNSAVVTGRIGNAESADSSLFCGDGFRAVDATNYAAFLRYSFRSSLRGDFTLRNLGFRCAGEAGGGAGLSERSVYRLDAPWTEDNGRTLRLRELQGVQVLTFFYSTCEGACPLTVKALQMLSRDRSSAAAHARFVLISVDPDRDTVEVLRRYRNTMHLDKRSWKLLRGATGDVRKLAALLGFNFEQIDSGEYVHSNLVTVLDARGEVVHQQSAVSGDRDALADAIRRAQDAAL
jgi:cytochrome oxidase Cu insertion factor (SCO1/SenC/PrrC family)